MTHNTFFLFLYQLLAFGSMQVYYAANRFRCIKKAVRLINRVRAKKCWFLIVKISEFL